VRIIRRRRQPEELLEGVIPALVVRLRQLHADVAQVPRLGHVPGGPGRALLVADDESVLPGMLGDPVALARAAELFDAAAAVLARDHVECEARLVLAEAGPGGDPIRALLAERRDVSVVGAHLEVVRAVAVV